MMVTVPCVAAQHRVLYLNGVAGVEEMRFVCNPESRKTLSADERVPSGELFHRAALSAGGRVPNGERIGALRLPGVTNEPHHFNPSNPPFMHLPFVRRGTLRTSHIPFLESPVCSTRDFKSSQFFKYPIPTLFLAYQSHPHHCSTAANASQRGTLRISPRAFLTDVCASLKSQ